MISENYIRTLLVQNPKINIIDFAKQYNLLTKNIDVSFIAKFLSMMTFVFIMICCTCMVYLH